MQLPLPAEVVVPVGVGLLVAVVAVIVLQIGLRQKVGNVPASTPSHDDWTGEHVGKVVTRPTRTVADALAARGVHSDSFRMMSANEADPVARGAAETLRGDEPALNPVVVTELDAQGVADVSGPAPEAAAPTRPVGGKVRAHAAMSPNGAVRQASPTGDGATSVALADPVAADVDGLATPGTAVTSQARHVGPGDERDRPDPLFGPFDAIAPANGRDPAVDHRRGSAGERIPGDAPRPARDDAGRGAPDSVSEPRGAVGPAQASGRPADHQAHGPGSGQPADHLPADGSEPGPAAGSSHSVAAAVAQVLAARAAAQSPDADRRGDARDRLLAVLLDDPMRAVGAAVDLQDCQDRMDRITATLNEERGKLGDVLGRLASSGLRPDQLARLSGLSDAEIADFLRRGLGG